MNFKEEKVRERENPYDEPFATPLAPSIGSVTAEEKQWGMFCHLSALAGLVVPGGNIIGPLVCWTLKKDTSPYVAYHGKESLNFQINMFIYMLICFALLFVFVGIVLFPIVYVYAVVMPIIAGIKANEGELYQYPATFRILT